MGNLAYKLVPVSDVCDIERGRAGKVYQSGTCYVALSATNDTVNQLKEPSEVDGRYAVLVPKDEGDGDYLKVVLDRAFPRWLMAHRTGINLKYEELASLMVEWHEDADMRQEVMTMARKFNVLIDMEQKTIGELKDTKQYLLLRMFV